MPVQRADDAGRQVRQPWLGAKGAKWLWEWTYQEWGLAAATFFVGGFLMTLVIPSAVIAFFGIRAAARWISSGADNPKRTFRLAAGSMVGLCAIYSMNPATWIKPTFWPIAIAVTLVLPFVAVRRWGRYVNWNRPIPYWFRLPGQVARGPRLPEPVILDPTPLLPDTDELDEDTDDLVPGRIVTVPRVHFRTWLGRGHVNVEDQATADTVNYWMGNGPKPKTPRPVKATITKAPKRPARPSKVPTRERRLVQPGAKPRTRRAFVERTPQGIRMGKTEYHFVDWWV